ncbi:helix-turn-helix domain-containing protein [Pararhodospirillum photometricum]|uniref:helix-turn-helix domain-containing protein n=1 Tax=Pararhodospirillum photometricum TaxID=1084 RepID=UPI0009D96CBF|nr:helix-turn-helix transcriptional regulator [Pararhodospirillum photometricum]
MKPFLVFPLVLFGCAASEMILFLKTKAYLMCKPFTDSDAGVSRMTLEPETVGSRLRSVRGDMSQDDFATLLGVHKQTIGKYERGIVVPGGDVLARLRAVLGIDVNWLLTGRAVKDAYEPTLEVGAVTRAAPSQLLDEDLFSQVIDGISKVYKDAGARIAPVDLGRLAARVVHFGGSLA